MSDDPVMHEPTLLQMLDCACGVDNTSRLQAGAMMSVVDAFDRRITRESFLKLMLAAFALHTQTAKLYMLGEVRESYRMHMHDPDPVTFENLLHTTQSDVLKMAIDIHTEVKQRTDLLSQCPTSKHLVH